MRLLGLKTFRHGVHPPELKDETSGLPIRQFPFAPMLAVPLVQHLGRPSVPVVREGEEVVLFLYGASDLGLTSPVGLGSGRFRVVRDKQGKRLAINDFGNATLMEGLSPGARLRVGGITRELTPNALLDLADTLGGER